MNAVIILYIGIILALIAYGIVMFILYKKDKGPFSPYVPPDLPNSFHPMGGTVKLTPQEQYDRCVQLLGESDPICQDQKSKLPDN